MYYIYRFLRATRARRLYRLHSPEGFSGIAPAREHITELCQKNPGLRESEFVALYQEQTPPSAVEVEI